MSIESKNTRRISILKRPKKRLYTQIDKEPIENPLLSLKAKGLLVYLMGLPDDWKIHKEEIATHHKDGIDSIKAAFKELGAEGYIKIAPIRDKKGRVQEWHTMVRDDLSISFESFAQEWPCLEVDFPHCGFSTCEESTATNKHLNKETEKHTHTENPSVCVDSLFEVGGGKISRQEIESALKKYTSNYVQEKILLTVNSNPDSSLAFFKAALRGNYKNGSKKKPDGAQGDISNKSHKGTSEEINSTVRLVDTYLVDHGILRPMTNSDRDFDMAKKYDRNIGKLYEAVRNGEPLGETVERFRKFVFDEQQ